MSSGFEIHIPISPTQRFFTMLHYFAASLQINGGASANSKIVVTVGADQVSSDLGQACPWAKAYPIEWRWLPRKVYREYSYYGTAIQRFCIADEGSIILMADADMLVARPFVDLMQSIIDRPALAGLVAHRSPFVTGAGESNREWWDRLFESAGLESPPFCCEHTGWKVLFDDENCHYCPPYFNLGMIAAPGWMIRAIGEVIYREMIAVDRVLDTKYRCQLALALAIQRLRLPWRAVGMRFNFPNHIGMDSFYRDEFSDVRLLHYMDSGLLDKQKDFESPIHVSSLIRRKGLTGANALIQQILETIDCRLEH